MTRQDILPFFVLVGIIWMSTGKNTREPKGEMLLEHKTNKDGKLAAQRESVAKKIWLNYYNNYLYEHHLITEEEKRKMQRKIERQGGGLGW
ncbi:hypothetical protein D5272_04210 [bacterium D16-76]|nr:hypothetical protein [bacterium D16-76]